MTARNIGGVLDMAALAALTGKSVTLDHHQHRPKDAQEIRAAVHELRNRGLGDHDIAEATRLNVEYVRRVEPKT